MINSIIKRVFIFIVSVLLVVPTCVINANEKNNVIDLNQKMSITIKHLDEDIPVSNTMFSLYQVCKVSDDAQLVFTDEFAKYDINIDDIYNQTKWQSISDTLETYVVRDKVKSYRQDVTKEDGVVRFDNLDMGIYLVVGNKGISRNYVLDTNTFLVSLPSKDSNTGNLVQNVELVTKKFRLIQDTIDYKVEKIWINDEDAPNKPTSIDVDLYRDGELYDSIVLSEQNNWEYIWTNLESNYDWTVVEKNVPKDYTVSYETYSTSTKIKNTYNKPNPTVKPPTAVLPQTGSPWIFAQGLALVGVILMSVGYITSKKNG